MKSKLIWEKSPQPGDDYALKLTNPEAADIVELNRLFATVKQAKGGRRDHLSAEATRAFEIWLRDLSQPLPSRAFALLSNWFLTEATVDRESSLGYACADFWDGLFAVRPSPSKRLTDEKKNWQIIDLRFEVWWGNQVKVQGKE